VAVIDPGPLDDAHLDAILAALEPDEKVTHVIITHTHLDHSPLAMPLKARTGAEIYSHAPGETETFDGPRLEEGTDESFAPDHIVAHGDRIVGDDWTLECVFTPGHMSGHMCYALEQEKALFSGDHVMGWSTTVIAPPDGDMTDYMASLDVLLTRDDVVYWPTHGTRIDNPQDFVRAYIAHRRNREAQVIERLKAGDSEIKKMVEVMYADVDKGLHPAAALSVLAHMQDLTKRGLVSCDSQPGLNSSYRLN
jgi:glyoxylase-like metal-dependent hydrolase (beta-lactamase superfamily II)